MQIGQTKRQNKPRDNLRELLTPKNETLTNAELYFYGDIVSDSWGAWDDEDQYPAAVRDFLRDHDGKSLTIYINSSGGDVFAGMTIYSMLRRYSGYKTVYVDGVAASIASVIALAGDRVVVPSNAYMMIHQPWSSCTGSADEMRKKADDLDRIAVGIMNAYRDNLADGADMADIYKMVDAETWLTGEDAAKYFRVEVGEPKQYAAMLTDAAKAFRRVPKEIAASAMPDDDDKINDSAATAEKIKRLVVEAVTKEVMI